VEGSDLCLPQRETGVILCMYVLLPSMNTDGIYIRSHIKSKVDAYKVDFTIPTRLDISYPS
jgi:hypothetical protein